MMTIRQSPGAIWMTSMTPSDDGVELVDLHRLLPLDRRRCRDAVSCYRTQGGDLYGS